MCWIQGGNLSQTLFASKLTLKVTEIQDSELQLAIKTIIKTCSLAHRFIMSVRVFEEDDFTSDTYQFDLMDSETPETLLQDLEQIGQKEASKDDFNGLWNSHLLFLRVIYFILTV
jgi:hypothetical protein